MKLGINKVEIDSFKEKLESAPQEQKSQVIVETIQNIFDSKYADITEKYREEAELVQADKEAAEKLGLRTLSKKEEQFYELLKNKPLRQSATDNLGGADDLLMPTTVVDYVFEDLKRDHPLFKHIEFVPAGLQKWILSENSGKAVWGQIRGEIKGQLEAEVKELSLDVNLLTAFMFIPRGIIDLGYKWIDRFVRTILQEAYSDGLEEGIVTGDGNNMPIGLGVDLEGAVVGGVYPEKTAVAITDFGPDSFNKEVLPILNRNGKRPVYKVIVVANQNDLMTIIYKATHNLSSFGYSKAYLPLEFEFVPSQFIEQGKAIAFIPRSYVAGVTNVGIATSDDYKFLERIRTYAIAGYANGSLKSNDSSVVLDITGLKPLATLVVDVNGSESEGA